MASVPTTRESNARNTLSRLAGACAALASAASAVAGVSIPLGVAQNDVWAYISAQSQADGLVMSAWGFPPNDLNPSGFPGAPGGPPNGANFYSHIFLGWTLPTLPVGFRWGGARITVTLASDSWVPTQGETYIRFLSRGFDETTWNVQSNTPVPVPALGRFAGADANATNAGDTIVYTLPASLDPLAYHPWLIAGQVYLALTADSSPPPPGQPGQPPDLTGALQVWSGEDIFGRGSTIELIPGRLGDTDGDGDVDFIDLNRVLSEFGQSGVGLRGDLNRDGACDFLDLNEVLGFFGT